MTDKEVAPRPSLVEVIRGRGKGKYFVTALGIETIESMAAIGHSKSEIAAYLRVSGSWMDNALDDENPAFDSDVFAAFEEGQGVFRGRLRNAQVNLADTNAQMAIHLGKHYLGQKDDVQQHHHVHQVVGTMPDYDATSAEWRAQFAPSAMQERIEAADIEDAEVVDVVANEAEQGDEVR